MTSRWRATPALLLALLGCDAPESEALSAREGASVAAEERAALQALGYADFSDPIDDPERSGVVVHEGEAVQPGYRLFVTAADCEATLIDTSGTVVRAWRSDPCEKWSHARILADGDLVVPGRDPRNERTPSLTYLLRLDWSGEVVWKHFLRAHHDAAPRPDGSLLALTSRPRRARKLFPEGAVIDNPIRRVGPDGALAEARSLLDALKERDGACALRPVPPSENGTSDLFHANAIEWTDRRDLAAGHPASGGPRLLVTLRHQDCVVMLDAASMEVVWEWGRGIIDGPHDATLLENGNILLFDNGMLRGSSRVLEVDPRSGAIVWEYPGETGAPIFTPGRGSSQRLPNGNTLLAESNAGRAIEVTPGGRIVWEFLNPRTRDGRRASIIRMRHYDADFVEAHLGAADPIDGPRSRR